MTPEGLTKQDKSLLRDIKNGSLPDDFLLMRIREILVSLRQAEAEVKRLKSQIPTFTSPTKFYVANVDEKAEGEVK